MPTRKSSFLDEVRDRAARLPGLLAEARREQAFSARDQVLSFERLCDRMFGTFSQPAASGAGGPAPNFDSGDASHPPFQPLLRALAEEGEGLAGDVHRYFGPDALGDLEPACRSFMVREGPWRATDLADDRFLPVAGTVQGFDAACRVLVQRPGDVVLLPALGYGFFITQAARCGGRTAAVPCDDRGAVTARALAQTAAAINARLWKDWKRASARDARGVARAIGLERSATAGLVEALRLFTVAVDAAVDPDVAARALAAVEAAAGPPWARDLLARLRPPRAVAFLQIQPAVSGHVYDEEEIHALAAAARRHRIVAIEDIAYHSIRVRLRDLPVMPRDEGGTITLLGFSKPMAVAGLRFGMAVSPAPLFGRLRRASESTIGFVSPHLQRAFASAFAAKGFTRYGLDASAGPTGYEARKAMFERLLLGRPGPRLAAPVESMRSEGVAEAALRIGLSGAERDAFEEIGLSRWLCPAMPAPAGFFQLVSCAPLLRSAELRRLGVCTAFDAFALLAYLFDLRTIPQEAMGPDQSPGQLLRFSFSADPALQIDRCLRAFAGLSVLDPTAPCPSRAGGGGA